MTPDHERRLARLEKLAEMMDSRYRIPLTGIRFGWDAILGLVPGLGDVAALGPAGFIFLEAHRMGAPQGTKVRMMANTGLDLVVGIVPLVGDMLDVGIRSNRRNVALLRRHVESLPGPAAAVRPSTATRPA